VTRRTRGGATAPPSSATILCLHGSPRPGGNTDILLDALAGGAAEAGTQALHLFCRDLEVRPCTGCGACSSSGECVIKDEMEIVYSAVDQAAAVVVGSPIYFLGTPSIAKRVIDRFQPRWARRHVLGIPPGPARPGALISTAGAPSHSVFGGVQRTVEALFEVVDVSCRANLFYSGIDDRGAIRDHPTALDEASALGRRLASLQTASP
jgi:multimeric flavodoxin WrbA